MRRLWVLLLGFFVLLIGLILIPLPGPGWLVILSGLGILAKEFGWLGKAASGAVAKKGEHVSS